MDPAPVQRSLAFLTDLGVGVQQSNKATKRWRKTCLALQTTLSCVGIDGKKEMVTRKDTHAHTHARIHTRQARTHTQDRGGETEGEKESERASERVSEGGRKKERESARA